MMRRQGSLSTACLPSVPQGLLLLLCGLALPLGLRRWTVSHWAVGHWAGCPPEGGRCGRAAWIWAAGESRPPARPSGLVPVETRGGARLLCSALGCGGGGAVAAELRGCCSLSGPAPGSSSVTPALTPLGHVSPPLSPGTEPDGVPARRSAGVPSPKAPALTPTPALAFWEMRHWAFG